MFFSRTSLGVFALVVFVALGCQTTHPNRTTTASHPLQHLEKGMTPDEVRRTLGSLRQTIRADSTVRWMEYGSTTHRFRIYFDGERVEALPRRSQGT